MNKYEVGFPGTFIGVYYGSNGYEAKQECSIDIQNMDPKNKYNLHEEIKENVLDGKSRP